MREINPKHLIQIDTYNKNKEKQDQEKIVIEDMIADGKLEPEKIEDTKYICALAHEMDWTVHQLNRAIRNAKVREELSKWQRSTQE